ncbi:galactose mutarotase [Staphylococcus pasteuri]|uniref:aldose epimerase family protein n=1 Tax=Staphylococcus pasteuri TaxID=45972 RepID=UPI000E682AC9|nr:galactose mutarotase [Staphylococcus pasteuri]MCT1926607.1 galactose mutarotase [Staphylococcus pasteuri]QQT12082.1 galactose mutarotase [Staphylococcus pasteuri]RIO54339.1 galactose mutarotase [Staphylococcus pasteuri]
MNVEIEHQRYGVDLIKIDNEETKIVFTNFGARIVSWKYHDNNIVLGNVVEADEFYFDNPFKFGATIGRYGGRISDASFTLDGKKYQLEANDGNHHIHGGGHGLDTKLFDYEVVEELGQVKIIFKTTLKETDDNYPGNMDVKVTHTYDVDHCWTVEYEATSTKTTLFNPMNHVYFNLNRDNNVIDNHRLYSSELNMYQLNEQHLINTDETLDLHQIFNGSDIYFKDIFESKHAQLAQQIDTFNGLDHPFKVGGHQLSIDNGEFQLDVKTDMPNYVLYTFNQPKDWNSDSNIYKAHSGLAIESQFLPNDINMYGEDASSILKANDTFYSQTSYEINEK